jgi:hypothetical protein
MLTFLRCPSVEPANNRAERAIRPAVVLGKISGGSRSDDGANAHAVIASVDREAACPARSRPAFEPLLSG